MESIEFNGPAEFVQPVALVDTNRPGVQSAVFHNRELPFIFKIVAVYNENKSKLLGREIYDNVEVIETKVDRFHTTVMMVDSAIRQRFAKEYNAWKAGLDLNLTAIERWEAILPGDRESLKAQGIRTVEQLAEFSEGSIAAQPAAFREIVEKARRHVKSKLPIEDVNSEMAQALKTMQARLAELEKQNQELRFSAGAGMQEERGEVEQEVSDQGAVVRRGPGRPRKV